MQFIIPVKPMNSGKTRLTSTMEESLRIRLIEALFLDALEAVLYVARSCSIYVVGGDDVIADYARRNGILRINDEMSGLNEAVSCTLMQVNDEPTVVLMPDLPYITGEGLMAWLGHIEERQGGMLRHQSWMMLAPSEDATGTNALCVSRPSEWVTSFGHGSLSRHCAYAEKCGINVNLAFSDRLAFDLDTPQDYSRLITEVSEHGEKVASHTRRLLDKNNWINQPTSGVGRKLS